MSHTIKGQSKPGAVQALKDERLHYFPAGLRAVCTGLDHLLVALPIPVRERVGIQRRVQDACTMPGAVCLLRDVTLGPAEDGMCAAVTADDAGRYMLWVAWIGDSSDDEAQADRLAEELQRMSAPGGLFVVMSTNAHHCSGVPARLD
jgi:hypothetical protein